MSIASLRVVTHLAPSIPLALFESVATHLERALETRVELLVETRASGPRPDGNDPLSRGEADVGFVCAPTLATLQHAGDCPVELLGPAPVFDDPRTQRRPVYYADVVVRHDDPATGFSELQGRRWGYNDTVSLSGYFCVLDALRRLQRTPAFFSSFSAIGSHLGALEALQGGTIDACAIDSNALAAFRRTQPQARRSLRVIESWGPYPIQPVVAHRDLPPSTRDAVAQALLRMTADHDGFCGFAPVDPRDYTLDRWAWAVAR